MHQKTSPELVQFFLAFKGSKITSLDVSLNGICHYYSRTRPIEELLELIEVFNELSITQLNFANNGLRYLSRQDIHAFFATFPKHITLVLSASELGFMPLECRQVITTDTRRLLLIDKNDKLINPDKNPLLYRKLCIKPFMPSLTELTTFFMANNPQISREGISKDLEDSLNAYSAAARSN